MQYRRLILRLRDWEQTTPRGRRAARLTVWFASILLVLVSLRTVLLETKGDAFPRYATVVFTFEGEGLDANDIVRNASSALPGILDVATFSLADAHFASLLVDTQLVVPSAVERRVRALVPPTGGAAPRSVALPLAPSYAPLFRSFGANEARLEHELSYTQSLRAWIASLESAQKSNATAITVVPDAERMKRRAVTLENLSDGLARAFAPRPPLVAREESRVLASEWNAPRADPGAVIERLNRMTVEGTDGSEVALSDVATIAVQKRSLDAVAPLSAMSEAKDPLLDSLAQSARLEASKPWSKEWGNVDWVVIALLSACALLVGFCSHRGPIAGEFALLLSFALFFAAFLPVTPVADVFPLPQLTLLFLCAGAWGFARTFPIRTRQGHAVRRKILPFVCAAISGLAFVASFRTPTASRAQRDGETPSAFSFRLREKDRREKDRALFSDGDTFTLPHDHRGAPWRSFELNPQAHGANGTPVLIQLMRPTSDSAPLKVFPRRLAAHRNGSVLKEARTTGPTNEVNPSPMASRRIWALLSLAAGAFSILLVSRAPRWVLPGLCVQVAATGVAWACVGLLARFSAAGVASTASATYPEGTPNTPAFVLFPAFVALATLAFWWLLRRTEHFLRRQKDASEAFELARGDLMSSVLGFFLCAGSCWPALLLYESTINATLLSIATLCGLALLPCLAAFLSRWLGDIILYSRLEARVARLDERRVRAGDET